MALDELQDHKSFGAHWSRLEEPYGDVTRKKTPHRAPFQEQIHCKLRFIIRKTLQIPGDFFKPIWGNESVVSLWRKRHFFQNAQNAGAVFPPTGCFWTFRVTKDVFFHGFMSIHV